jgi:hypothetical protein
LGSLKGSIGELPTRASTYASSYVCSLLGAPLASWGSLLEAESSTVQPRWF